jgi:hypothetical protein
MKEVCPQCNSDDPEVLEIACIRSPEPHRWHIREELIINFPIDIPL